VIPSSRDITPDGLSGLVKNWTFAPSAPGIVARLARLKSVVVGLRGAPAVVPLTRLQARRKWNGYFIYAPDGQLGTAHRYTLRALRALEGGLLVICATPHPRDVPADLARACDALYWKDLSGYDFSAYSLAMREVAVRSPGADLLLLNDSVLGPFGDLSAILAQAPWQLTGFTAWSAFENHLQSYAFLARDVTASTLHHLRSVLPSHLAFNHFQQVVNCQETRLARVAARTITVGALWFEPGAADPSLARAVALLRDGFPFLKRSLVAGKLADRADQELVRQLLQERGHPV
jgi:hypothetical protein